MNDTILITGGAGFIGSHTVDLLTERGHRVSVLDDLSTGRRTNLAHWENHPNFAFVHADVTSDLTAAFERVVLRHGRMMPVGALDMLRQHDAILLGAVGHPDIPDHITLNGLLLPILLHCRDDQGQPLLGPPQSGRETPRAYADIPPAVEAIRQHWMPIRYARPR